MDYSRNERGQAAPLAQRHGLVPLHRVASNTPLLHVPWRPRFRPLQRLPGAVSPSRAARLSLLVRWEFPWNWRLLWPYEFNGEVRPFKIEVPQAALDDPQDRLARTRWATQDAPHLLLQDLRQFFRALR